MPPDATSILTHFEPFSLFHLACDAAFAALVAGSLVLGLRWRTTAREVRFRRTWGWFIVLWQCFAQVYWLTPAQFDIAKSLPLQLCDLAVWSAAFAMLTNARLFHTLTYFWGIALSSQAFFTPILKGGLATFEFWQFWIGHTQIVGTAIYLVVVRAYRPTGKDFVTAAAATFGLAALVQPINVGLGVNYLYLGDSRPEAPTIVDALGPWPWRIYMLGAVAHAAMFLIWIVWPIARRLGGRGRAAAPPG